jgi:hypothetical protein
MWTAYPQCAGAKVLDVEDEWFDDTWSGPVIGAQRGMRCVISVEVRNNSGGTVRVDEANLMFMGPGAGAIVKVDTSADPHLWDVLSPFDDRDLIRSLGVTLEPGEQTTFDVPVVFRDGGCNGGAGGGGQTIIHGFPVVTVSTLLRSFKAVAVNDLAFSQHGPSRGCARA